MIFTIFVEKYWQYFLLIFRNKLVILQSKSLTVSLLSDIINPIKVKSEGKSNDKSKEKIKKKSKRKRKRKNK